MDKESAALAKLGKAAVLGKEKNVMKTLAEELDEGETQITKKMKEEKAEFIKKFSKHQIKARDEDFEEALERKHQVNVLSVKKHRSAEDIEELEESVKGKKSGSKRHKHHE